jgi:putative inorganic carbon (hco3(-)) transporter
VSDPASPHSSELSQNEKVRVVSPDVWGWARSAIWALKCYGLLLIIFVSFFPRLSHFEEYLFFTLFVIAVGAAWREGRTMWFRTPVDLPLLLFVGWVLLTVPFAIDSGYSFAEWRKFIAHVLLFYWSTAVLEVYGGQRWFRGVMWAIVSGSIILSGYALVDFLLQGGTWRDRIIRASAPSSDYNWLSTYMVLVIPLITIGLVLVRRSLVRGVFALGALMGLMAQVFSYSRAGWLSSFLQVCVGTLVMGRRIGSLLVLAGGVLVLGAFLAFSRLGYQSDTVAPLTIDARVEVWKLAVQTVVEHPVVGVGYGNGTFMSLYSGNAETKRASGSHNTYLMIAMGSGLPALVLFAWIFVRAGRVLYRSVLVAQDWVTKLALLAFSLSSLGFLVRNMFDVMFIGSLGCLFWIIMACGLSLAKHVQEVPAGQHVNL